MDLYLRGGQHAVQRWGHNQVWPNAQWNRWNAAVFFSDACSCAFPWSCPYSKTVQMDLDTRHLNSSPWLSLVGATRLHETSSYHVSCRSTAQLLHFLAAVRMPRRAPTDKPVSADAAGAAAAAAKIEMHGRQNACLIALNDPDRPYIRINAINQLPSTSTYITACVSK